MGGIEMKTETSDLLLFGMVESQAGFKVFEDLVRGHLAALDHLDGVGPDAFENGLLKGEARGISQVLYILASLRRQLKEIQRKEEA